MDFWISADDKRISGVLDTNSAAATSDDSQYHHFYSGYYDSFATEVEDPYPMFVGASATQYEIDPSGSSGQISGLSECFRSGSSATNTSMFFYASEVSGWVTVANTTSGSAASPQGVGMFPMVQASDKIGTFDSDGIADDGPVSLWTGVGSTGRAASTRRLYPIPGATTAYHYPIPLTLYYRPTGSFGGTTDTTKDSLRGSLANWFWVFNTSSAGADIANFAEDYITVGSDRYRVFHTHVQKQRYHYVCVKETT
jgi:hypothetical protein